MTTDIRPATEADLPTLRRLSAILLRSHHDFDNSRFVEATEEAEVGFNAFLAEQIGKDNVALLIAERENEVLGYVYASIEPLSWTELRHEAGFIHDVAVVQNRRGAGVAQVLIDAALSWFRSRQVKRVMLWTAEKNPGAQQLFTRLGFRRTMVEMTRELA